jgi:exonuclease SbcC
MRPVLLEMDGFASFRQRTTVDFDEADYFALIGATGAGKSTAIDAITFALYGSVARWDDAGAVSPALAPTVNRGTVRLIFDVRGARYQAMRELRRNGTGRVQQKIARLERFLEPDARGDIGDPIELVAGSISETAAAVEQLLGLDFNQFTKCVALPQGEFAEFLHAKPSDRDKILTKLLGLDGYLALGRTANARAARMTTQADTLQHQLDQDETDTSDAALQAAHAQHAALDTLNEQVQTDLTALAALGETERTATNALTEIDRTLTVLGGLSMPEHVATVDHDLACARTALDEAKTALGEAEKAEGTARTAVREYTPRGRLESWAQQHTQHQQLTENAPLLAERVATTLRQRGEADTARGETRTVRTGAELAEREAHRKASDAQAMLAGCRTTLAELQAVTRPADVGELCAALGTAQQTVTTTSGALEAAQRDHREAVARRDALPSAVALERVGYALSTAGAARAAVARSVNAVTAALAQARAAAVAAAGAQTQLAEAEQAASASHARHVAAQLRADLTPGDTCPVCEQDVAQVPAPADAEDAAAAEQALAEVRKRVAAADRDAARVETALETAAGTLRERHATLQEATAALQPALLPLQPALQPELPAAARTKIGALSKSDATSLAVLTDVSVETDPDNVTRAAETAQRALGTLDEHLSEVDAAVLALQQRCAQADNDLGDAATALHEADLAHKEADRTLNALSARTAQSRAHLREARDPLVALGAPNLDDTDLPGAWAALTAWVEQRVTQQEQVVDDAERTAEQASARHQQALTALQEAQTAHETAEATYEQAVRQHEQAAAAELTAQAQLRELATALADAPPAERVTQQLEVLTGLELACETAEQTRTRCRAELGAAEARLSELAAAHRSARAELGAARDPLVPLGAPALPNEDEGLVASWTRLLDWASSTRSHHLVARVTAERALSERTAARQAADTALRQALTEAGLSEDPRPLSTWAAAAVATAAAQAAGQVQAIEEARRRTASLQEQIRADREQAAVALQLARLLASNAFPRWLSKSALEVLVVAASTTLMELSGGQFELSVSDNDAASFTVIDHADADAERPVKTLSGGETFQASLSLALALSTHLGALASNGAAQLDAIFIDEGFGTLDENTLDTVAATLETLATSAGRMVGIITHVQQLAARVPVQFSVQRDPRGSSIARLAP